MVPELCWVVALLCFFFLGYGDHRDLHSFPTRRSSDLLISMPVAQARTISAACASAAEISAIQVASVQQELTDAARSEEHTSELQSPDHLVCRLLLEKKKLLRDPCRAATRARAEIGTTA